MATPLKTRFAPSPTGLLHLGNIRTALFNVLLAKQSGGSFLLRIEDTDRERSKDEYTDALMTDLRWLGLQWQEGPGVDAGTNAPSYCQSQRSAIYAGYAAKLEQSGRAYPCFCTEQELKLARKTQLAAGKPPRYSGRCRNLSADEVKERLARGLPASLRFRVPSNTRVEFNDRVRGAQTFNSDDIGDFIIRRSDGTPAFFFTNAIDDALMAVNLVVRGEDHLTNTPRQIMLLQALNLPVPEYAHIALVVGADGAPLSKRHGSRTVQEMRASGFFPAAINNYLARVGHSYESNSLMNLDELAQHFDAARLGRAPARYDELQLFYWQKQAVSQASNEELWRWMADRKYFGEGRIEDFVQDKPLLFVQAIRDNIVTPIDAFIWAGNLYSDGDIYDSDARAAIRDAGSEFFVASVDVIKEETDFKRYVKRLGEATGQKGKSLFLPLRAALTAEIDQNISDKADAPFDWHAGPELVRVWELLGIERVRRKLGKALRIANDPHEATGT